MLEFIKWLPMANQYRQKKTSLPPHLFENPLLAEGLATSFQFWLSENLNSFLFDKWLNQQKKYLSLYQDNPTSIALGHHIFTTDAPFLPPLFFEVFIPLIQQGNSLTFFYHPHHATHDLVWLQGLQTCLPEGALQLLPYQTELWHFAINHPGVKNVLCYQAGPNKIHLPSSCYSSLFNKNHYFSSLGKASLIILSEQAIKPALDQLIHSLEIGQGFLPFNISRVLVTQKIENLFKEKLKEKFKSHTFLNPLEIPSSLSHWRPKETEVIGSQGRIIAQSQLIRVIENVSNCSEFQLKPLYQPWVLLTDIKYPFEATKWINPAEHHGITLIWADDSFKLQPPDWVHKLETTHLLINEEIHKAWELSWWQATKAGAQGELRFSWTPKVLI